MKFLEKHPLIMIVIGIAGISLSAIFVKYSQAPSVVTAFYRLMWTVVLMTPVVFGRGESRRELMGTDRKSVLLCALSGLFLAMHFTTWFESLNKTSVASSTAIVCTEQKVICNCCCDWGLHFWLNSTCSGSRRSCNTFQR